MEVFFDVCLGWVLSYFIVMLVECLGWLERFIGKYIFMLIIKNCRLNKMF